jgi:hypothetical protein
MKQSLMVLLLAIALVVTACGGDSEASSGVASLEATGTVAAENAAAGGETIASEIDQEQAMLTFAACMRDNGVDIDDPTVDADGNVQFGAFRGVVQAGEIDRATMDAAMEVCQEHLEGIALGRGGGDFDLTELEDTMVEYAACMRTNGYDMADPDFSNFGPGNGGEPGEGGGRPFADIDLNDPDFISAQEVCQDILGGFRGPGTRPPGGTG